MNRESGERKPAQHLDYSDNREGSDRGGMIFFLWKSRIIIEKAQIEVGWEGSGRWGWWVKLAERMSIGISQIFQLG